MSKSGAFPLSAMSRQRVLRAAAVIQRREHVAKDGVDLHQDITAIRL
jgi:hypothetical protein